MGKKSESVKKTESAKASPKPAAKKPAAKTVKTVAPREPVARVKAVEKTIRKPIQPKKPAAEVETTLISYEDIALRAYYISENRRKNGLHGNSDQDWLEAERQLIAELKKSGSAKSKAF